MNDEFDNAKDDKAILNKLVLVTARYTFGPEFEPKEPYCWSCMLEKPEGTVMRTSMPPAPAYDFCPRCVELCKTPEKIRSEKTEGTSKPHPHDTASAQRQKKRIKRQRGVLPEDPEEKEL